MKLLIWKFKYDDYYFDVSTAAQEDAAYRYMFDDLEEDFQAYCELTQENIAEEEKWVAEARECRAKADAKQLSEFMQDAARTALKNLDERERYLDDLQRQYALYQKAKTGDIKSIRALVQHRSRKDHEYETFRIVETTAPVKRKKKVRAE
jgi:hypothetical protein